MNYIYTLIFLALYIIRINVSSWTIFFQICAGILALIVCIAAIIIKRVSREEELKSRLRKEKQAEIDSMESGLCPKCKLNNVSAVPVGVIGDREYQKMWFCSDCQFEVADALYEKKYYCPNCHAPVKRSDTYGSTLLVDKDGSPHTDLDHAVGSAYFPGVSSAKCTICGWERPDEEIY